MSDLVIKMLYQFKIFYANSSLIEKTTMKNCLILFIIFFSTLTLAQNNLQSDSITTKDGTNYYVSQQIRYTKKIMLKNKGKIFLELHPEQTSANFPKEKFILRDSTKYFIGYIVNGTEKNLSLQLQDGSLFMIQEAQNNKGEWLPIEHWEYSWCGNSYYSWLGLDKKYYAVFPVRIYSGNYKTKIRLKMLDDRTKKIYYSESFEGQINPSYFKNPNWKKGDKSNRITYFD